jgi:hypothetical protein
MGIPAWWFLLCMDINTPAGFPGKRGRQAEILETSGEQ